MQKLSNRDKLMQSMTHLTQLHPDSTMWHETQLYLRAYKHGVCLGWRDAETGDLRIMLISHRVVDSI